MHPPTSRLKSRRVISHDGARELFKPNTAMNREMPLGITPSRQATLSLTKYYRATPNLASTGRNGILRNGVVTGRTFRAMAYSSDHSHLARVRRHDRRGFVGIDINDSIKVANPEHVVEHGIEAT